MPRDSEQKAHAPRHVATGIPGVVLFEERESKHHYRVWHEDWYAFCIVERGSADVRYRGRVLPVRPETVTPFMPGEVHETRRIEVPGTYRVLMLPTNLVEDRAESMGKRSPELAATTWTQKATYGAFAAACSRLEGQSVSTFEKELLLLELVDLALTRDDAAGPDEASPHSDCQPRVIQAVRDYLVENFDRSLALADVARDLGLSSGYVSRAFSTAERCPPKTLLRLLRVERGRRSLLSPDVSVKRAAYDAGFTSPQKFNQAFQVAWNMSPSQYQQLALAQQTVR
jgi:AraC-like DNA-binding protein